MKFIHSKMFNKMVYRFSLAFQGDFYANCLTKSVLTLVETAINNIKIGRNKKGVENYI